MPELIELINTCVSDDMKNYIVTFKRPDGTIINVAIPYERDEYYEDDDSVFYLNFILNGHYR